MEEYAQITLNEWTQWKDDIRKKLEETASNFVYIGYRLKQIRESGMFDGAADIFEFAQTEYGLSKSTVSRFIAINEKYSEGGNSLELKEEYKNFSSSKLTEMLTLSDDECELITEKTTVKEIRELKNFSRQQDSEEPEETERTPLENCIIDYFEKRKETLNSVIKLLNEEEPRYKEASELMNPSGQNSYKKGIVFLFLYDWNMGVKYKLLTSPKPVSMTWPDFLNEIYHIYADCEHTYTYLSFYGKNIETVEEPKEVPEEKKETEKPTEKNPSSTEINQGFEPSVATSQREKKEEQKLDEEEVKTKENEPTITDAKGIETEAEAEDEQIDGQFNICQYPDCLPDEEVGRSTENTDTVETPLPALVQLRCTDDVITIPITKLMRQASDLAGHLYEMFGANDDVILNKQELQRCEEKAQELAAVIGQMMEV